MSKSDKKPAKAEAAATKTETPTVSVLENARGKAAGVVQSTIALLEANPLAALIGGIVLGTAVGALIPRGEKEKALLAPLGDKLAAAATAAIAAGREAGVDALKGGSLDKDALREQVSGLFGEATKAASAAGLAAFTAGKEKISG